MLDKILTFIVVIGPTIFALGVEVMSEEVRKDKYWKWGVMVFGLILSTLTWWQISRQENSASIAQESAIERVAAETSKEVTKAVSGQYQDVVKNLNEQIGVLKGQLASQSKDLSLIKGSNIVTGKNPVKVEVTNQPPNATSVSPPVLIGIRIASQKRIPSDDPKLPFGLEVIVQTDTDMEPVALAVICDGPIGKGNGGLLLVERITSCGRALRRIIPTPFLLSGNHQNGLLPNRSSLTYFQLTPYELLRFSK